MVGPSNMILSIHLASTCEAVPSYTIAYLGKVVMVLWCRYATSFLLRRNGCPEFLYCKIF